MTTSSTIMAPNVRSMRFSTLFVVFIIRVFFVWPFKGVLSSFEFIAKTMEPLDTFFSSFLVRDLIFSYKLG